MLLRNALAQLRSFFPHSQKKSLATRVLLYGASLWYFGEGMLGPLLSVFTEKIGGDVLDISLAWSLYLIVAGILNILVGKLSDRYQNKERIMVCGYALNALFTFGYILVDSPVDLFFVQVGLGIAASMATPTWDALFAHHEDVRQDGFQWGLAGGSAEIINGIAILIGGLIISKISFEALFFTMGVIQIIATIYQSKILRLK